MNKQPLFIVMICFILGIFFEDRFLLDAFSKNLLIIFCLGILILIFFSSYFLYRAKAFLIGLLFFGIGIIVHSYAIFPSESELISSKSKEVIIFKISKKLNSTDKYKRYESIVKIKDHYLNSILYIPKEESPLDFNHYYSSEAYMSRVNPSQYDFQFDYAGYLKRKNIEYQFYSSNEISSVMRMDLSMKEKVAQKRLKILQKIDQSSMSRESREFLKGIILADRTEIDSTVVQDFNKSGLVHFLAISGTHIMVIFGLFYFLFTRITPLYLKKYAIIISLGFIWLFAAFIGFGNSILRACIMLSTYFTYILLQRKPDVLHSVALSAFIILIMDSHQVFNIGFQLSFIAVLGIFWLNQPILDCFPKQDRYWKKIAFNTISISLSAQLATLPLVLYYFHQFSLIALIANFVIVPFSEVIITCSFVMATLVALGLDFGVITMVYDFVIHVLLKSIHWFAGFDCLFFKNISMNKAEVGALYIIIYLLRFLIRKLDFRNTMNFVMVSILFFIGRLSFDIIENQREEILMYAVNKNKVFSVKKGSNVCFWVSQSSDKEKITKYIIDPYITSRRVKNVQLKSLDERTKKIIYHDKIYDIN